MRAHELAAGLKPDGPTYKAVMAAVKFDLGEVDDAWALSGASSNTFFEIPAPICLFEVWNERDKIPQWYLARDIEPTGEGEACCLWELYFTQNDCLYGSTVMVVMYRNGEMQAVRRDAENPEHYNKLVDAEGPNADEQQNIHCICTIARAIEAFSCCNVSQVEHKPPKFINAKRIAKGKVPFFSYRTLHITGDSAPKAGDAAPTANHASPRLHLRRGHIRRITDGRRIWVRAHLVGDKSKGFAAKDYAVDKTA